MRSIRLANILILLFAGTLLAQTNPVPLVNNPLVPSSAAPGEAGFTLTVNGTGFVANSVVRWNGNALSTNFVTSSQLTATVLAADLANAGTASISITNPAPGGGTSNVDLFEIRQPFTAASFGQSVLTAGSRPVSVTAADLNGDGKVDLVGTNAADSTISVWLGNGDATFQTQVTYAVAAFPGYVAVGDFNGDGHLDLAVSTGGSVSILLGNGDGTFQGHQDISLDNSGTVIATADFNQDGRSDLAVPLLVSGQVAILLGNGDGTFQSAVDYTAGSEGAIAAAVGDFNRDGKLDLAVTVDALVAVLLGNGDGTFQNGVEYATMPQAGTLVTGDLNGDGTLDLVVHWVAGSGFAGGISILLGNGDGTFPTHVDYSAPEGGPTIGTVAADFNGDGRLDVAATDEGHRISTFTGNGDGTLQSPGLFATGFSPASLAVGDFDGDGRLDLVSANNADNTFSVLPQVTSVLSKTNISFGAHHVGSQAKVKVSLSNIGDSAFTISKIVLVNTKLMGFRQTNNCGAQLAAGASCVITLFFKPTGTAAYAAVLKVSDSATTIQQSVSVQGTGIH
jgi:hypothetical protein